MENDGFFNVYFKDRVNDIVYSGNQRVPSGPEATSLDLFLFQNM